jgi:hypothetical protein
MKVEKDTLNEFLTKSKFSGDDELREVILDFSEEGLNINAVCDVKTSMVKGILKKDVFTDYEAFGEIGIMHVANLLRVVNSFDKVIDLRVEGNLLIMKEGSRKVELEYANPEVINKVDINLEIEFDEEFKIDAKLLNKFISRASINNDFDINLTTQPGKLLLKNTKGSYKFTEEIDIPSIEKEVSVTFGNSFVNVVSPLNEEVVLCLKTDAPAKIKEIKDNSEIEIITSPLTEN